MSLWFRKPDDGLAAGAVGPHQLPSLNITTPTWPLESGEFMVWRWRSQSEKKKQKLNGLFLSFLVTPFFPLSLPL